MAWYRLASEYTDDLSNKYIDDILVEEARLLSDSSNVHRLNQILSGYLGAAQMLVRGSSPEMFTKMLERKEKELKDFISGEKRKRALVY